MNVSDRDHQLSGPWQIADYGNPDYVNLLDEHGQRVAWQIRRADAEQIIAGQLLLLATERADFVG
jgi:hypothetical protein